MAAEGAVVVYGRGDTLGNFRLFADDLLTTELSGYERARVVVRNIERRAGFFDLLAGTDFGFRIKALHIYSHAYGAALALGYGDPDIKKARGAAIAAGRASYNGVLDTEIGSIFVDDLVRAPYAGLREKLRALFAADARIKIWGCNSAVPNWVFSDVNGAGAAVVDPTDTRDSYYYWRALNERYVPKPSVAQAFADYFKVTTLGASSGSSIQVRLGGKWLSRDEYMRRSGRRTVGEPETLRLAPDKGDYDEYTPR